MHSNDPQKNHENELPVADLNVGITNAWQTGIKAFVRNCILT